MSHFTFVRLLVAVAQSPGCLQPVVRNFLLVVLVSGRPSYDPPKHLG